MEILGIGPLEALFILLIALIAVGPKDLGKAARSMGRMLNQLYKSDAWQNLSEASRSIRTLPNRLAREAALEELAQVKREMEEGVTAGMDQWKSDLEQSTETEPSAADDQSTNAELSSNNQDSHLAKEASISPDTPQADKPKDGGSPSEQPGVDQSKDVASAPVPPDPSPQGSSSEEN